MTIQIQRTIQNVFHYVLHRLFDFPSVVLIGGTWKSGKTDFSLFLSEWLLKLPLMGTTIINEVASNIDTKGIYPHVYDNVSIRRWLYSSNRRKLYICDEGTEHLYSRRSMSSKSVGFINLVPQISKAHGRMIVIAHNLQRIDKELLEAIWCRGIFIKTELKKAELFSGLLPKPYVFNDVPPTSIPFDPYLIAPLQERPPSKMMFKDEDKQLLWDWANGSTSKDLGIKRMTLHRKVKSYIKQILESECNM